MSLNIEFYVEKLRISDHLSLNSRLFLFKTVQRAQFIFKHIFSQNKAGSTLICEKNLIRLQTLINFAGKLKNLNPFENEN